MAPEWRSGLLYTIELNFYSFEEVDLPQLIGAVGVYVLWAPNARKTPTYVGEGDLMSRLSKHKDWLSKSVTGLIAILGYQGSKKHRALRKAKIAEAFLLGLADHLGRWPPKNKSRGNINRLIRIYNRHGVIRVTVRGYHPFRRPKGVRGELRYSVRIWLRFAQGARGPVPQWEVVWHGKRQGASHRRA